MKYMSHEDAALLARLRSEEVQRSIQRSMERLEATAPKADDSAWWLDDVGVLRSLLVGEPR